MKNFEIFGQNVMSKCHDKMSGMSKCHDKMSGACQNVRSDFVATIMPKQRCINLSTVG